MGICIIEKECRLAESIPVWMAEEVLSGGDELNPITVLDSYG